jgi:hypothetical protein
LRKGHSIDPHPASNAVFQGRGERKIVPMIDATHTGRSYVWPVLIRRVNDVRRSSRTRWSINVHMNRQLLLVARKAFVVATSPSGDRITIENIDSTVGRH